jgi:selenocysteine-specific elongation factor
MIVGTAGHIDHGKTLLVKALTGVETDRLKEEKARGITIELGFAYVPIPDTATPERPGGDILGFVDVPGHERFVHTMLAGAASVDFVVLVVAADDGVMPQTREHVQILDLLGIRDGVVALNKIDLVDAERLAEVEAQIRAVLAGTGLAEADILPVSAATGAGIEDLKLRLLLEAASRPERALRGAFRLGVDRSFSVQGAGTVVTGAIQSGSVAVGDRVVVLPQGAEVRVRGLHAQGRRVERAFAGERTAVNLAGIEKDGVRRGDWLCDAGHRALTQRFDATFKLLASEPAALKSWSPVHLHVGTSAVSARVVTLEAERIAPGAAARVQIVAETALPLRFGDRFVLRDAAAERTIGGGSVIDPRAPQRKRRTPERRRMLDALAEADSAGALGKLMDLPPGIADVSAFVVDRGLSEQEAEAVLAAAAPRLVEVGGRRFAATAEGVERTRAKVEALLAQFHKEAPALSGMPQDTLRLKLDPRPAKPQLAALLALLAADGSIVVQAGAVRLASHTSSLGAADQKLWERIKRLIAENRLRPPQVREIAEQVGQPITAVRKLLKTMARIGELVEVATDRFFLREALGELGRIAVDLAGKSHDKSFTAAEFKDAAGCGRNVGIQVLEFFDRRGITLRKGDARIVVKPPEAVLG